MATRIIFQTLHVEASFSQPLSSSSTTTKFLPCQLLPLRKSRENYSAAYAVSYSGQALVRSRSTNVRPCGCSFQQSSSGEEEEQLGVASQIERLQADLDDAVRAEEYLKAAQLRDKLRSLEEDTEAAVIAANSLFYRAFQNGDSQMMKRLWATGDHVQCLHPGSFCISGYDMVMESWFSVLEGSRNLRIDLEEVRVHVSGSMAFVTCIEVLRGADRGGRVIATNVFEKQGASWRICLHHGAAAPIPIFSQ